MLKRIFTTLTVLFSLTLASSALAQPSTTLNYEMAQRAMEAAVAEARANDWNVAIVITDHEGVPVMIHRMDGAGGRFYDIASRKAVVVIATGLTSGEYGQRLRAGEIEEVEGGVTFAGGVPIMLNGEMIGAITASGVRANQDEQISLAGVAAITN